jgi:hypothetical protein
MDLSADMSPTGGFRYPAIAVQLVELGVCIRLPHTAEAGKMGLRMDAFLSGLYANHTAGASSDPALRSSRTYVHNCPVLVFLLPGNSTGTGVSSAVSLPSVST